MSLMDFLRSARKTPVVAGALNDEKGEEVMLLDDTKRTANDKLETGYGKTPFSKQLGWKMKTSDTELMLITPAIATEMLAYNSKNRPPSPSTVKKYAGQMQAGNWRLTRQPIIFARSGRIQDGQHRLLACVESGVSFQAYVAFGDDEENFAFIDIGKGRTGADIFAINGVQNYAAMAAATRWIKAYDDGSMSGGPTGLSVVYTAADLYNYFCQLHRLPDATDILNAFAEARIMPPSLGLALHYICARKNRSKADEWFMQVATGVGISSRNETAWKLRKRLLENAAATGKVKSIVLAAYTIKAWNAERSGSRLNVFRWRGEQNPTETFPKAI